MKEKDEKRGNYSETLSVFLKQAFKYKGWLFLAILSTLIAVIANVYIPILGKKFIDEAVNNNYPALFEILTFMGLVMSVRWLFFRLQSYSVMIFITNGIKELYNKCFNSLFLQSFRFFNDNFVGSLTRRVDKFVNAFEMFFEIFIFDIFKVLLSLTLVIYVFFTRNVSLGIFIIIWSFVFLTTSYWFAKLKKKYELERSEYENIAGGLLADNISNNLNVKLFNGLFFEKENFDKAGENVRRLNALNWNLANVFWGFQSLMSMFLYLGMLYLGIKFFRKNLFTIGDFLLIFTYSAIIMDNLYGIGNSIERVFKSFSNSEEMTKVLIAKPEVQDGVLAKKISVTKGVVEFKNVNFNYKDSVKVIEKFNFKIATKEKVALVGPSGAGKSTIIKLLLRMFDIQGGLITIDDQNIKKISQESLWENISFVPQDPALFHRSLFENIAYGKKDATKEEVYEAAKKAYAHEFISKLKNGYDTEVGERGIKLSGGERQRVAIARAILKNAPILIMDEATSSLDSESEQLIQKALENLMKEKTVIIVAHRLSTIAKMDRVIVMENGKIIEEGDHNDLVKKGGLYAKLWHIQAGGFIV